MNNTSQEWKNVNTKVIGVCGIGGDNHQIKPSMLI
jgi:hypothetical protein